MPLAFGRLSATEEQSMVIAKEEVAEAVRAWCTAIHTRDIPTVVTMEAQAGGFGYRQLTRRDHVAVGRRGVYR